MPPTRSRTTDLVLDTRRLRLHVPRLADAGRLARFYARNREHIGVNEPLPARALTTEVFWSERLPGLRSDADSGRSLVLLAAAREGGEEMLGSVSLIDITRGSFHHCYVGFALDAQAQGQGLMGEALTRVLRYAFEDLGLHRVMANHAVDNERSGKLLRRLGFQQEGVARGYRNVNGIWMDHVLTALINPAWRTPDPA